MLSAFLQKMLSMLPWGRMHGFTIFLCTCIIKICSNCSKWTKIYNSYYWRSLYYFLFWLGWISTILYWLNRKPQTINAKMTNLLSLEDPPFLRFVAPILEHIVSVLNWDSRLWLLQIMHNENPNAHRHNPQ